MNKNRILAASAALSVAMGAAATASAATVNNANSANDPRYMTTGCKYVGVRRLDWHLGQEHHLLQQRRRGRLWILPH